jgi:integrase
MIPISENLYQYLICLNPKEGFVIPGTRTVNSISKQFRKAVRKIELNDITFHNLPDTFASWLVQSNYSLLVVKELLGHEDIKTTVIYAHLAPNNHIDAIKVIDNLLLQK